jgi:hypothetical protein
MTDWLLDGVFGWLAARLADVLGWLLSTLTASFFTSPDVTGLPQVRGLADRSAGVVAAMFVLAILAAGVLSMTHGSLQVQYQAKDLLPRLVTGLALPGFALPLCRGLIELANALTTALVGQAAAGPRVVAFVQVQLKAVNRDPAAQAMAAVITLLIVVLIFQLLLSLMVRIATLLVVAGLGPVALACYALPQTQPAAVLWWRCLLGALVTPALQGVAFSVGVDLLLDPGQNLAPMTGISGVGGSSGTTVLNLFFVACLLMLAVRIPKLVTRYAIRQGGGSSTAGVIARTIVVQTVLRRLPIPGLSRLAR